MSSPDRKRPSTASVAVAAPKESASKKPKRASAAEAAERRRLKIEAQGTKETFHFGQHRGKTFVEIAQDDPGYHERYMYILRKKGMKPKPVLTRYINWFNKSGRAAVSSRGVQSAYSRSRQAKSSEGESRFTFGAHKGQTFRQVAREDPSYHLRCQETGYCPDGMSDYTEYFSRNGDHNAAAWDEREILGGMLGMAPPECWHQNM